MSAARVFAKLVQFFTAIDFWVADQVSHFKNEVMKSQAKGYRIKHRFTVAYSPWINGTMENCMRHILSACLALLSEFKLGHRIGL